MTLVLLSLATLGVGACASLALCRWPRVSVLVSMLAIAVASGLCLEACSGVLRGAPGTVEATTVWQMPLGSARLAMDALSAWFLMTISVLALCVSVYTPSYMNDSDGHGAPPFFGALMCSLVASMILVVCAADAVLFLVAWEGVSLSAYFLILSYHTRDEVRRGAWMYLIATHLGTALCVAPLFGAMTALAHTTNFFAYSGALANVSGGGASILFALGLVGFGVKAGILPMHVWLPAAHPVAPTPVSALLSGVVVKIGVYGIVRMLGWLPALPLGCCYTLFALGVISGVMGVLYALAQHDLKRLLAYHTVENIGIIVMGIAVGMLGQTTHRPVVAMLGYAGALLHVTNHALFKGLLFLSAGAVLHGTGTVDIERLGGLSKKTPVNALMFLIGAVAICGLPPLNGFVSEWVIYGGLFKGALLGLRVVSMGAALGVLALALMGGARAGLLRQSHWNRVFRRGAGQRDTCTRHTSTDAAGHDRSCGVLRTDRPRAESVGPPNVSGGQHVGALLRGGRIRRNARHARFGRALVAGRVRAGGDRGRADDRSCNGVGARSRGDARYGRRNVGLRLFSTDRAHAVYSDCVCVHADRQLPGAAVAAPQSDASHRDLPGCESC